jgi:uncharacterized protein (DUF2062 family)
MMPARPNRGNSKTGPWNGLRRLMRFRLIIPVLRASHPPEYTARGVLIGMLVAMTPTVGIQMAICAVIWAAIKVLRPKWDFNVIVAMAWTWVSNVFTLGPLYYLFLITGEVMLGRWGDVGGYDAFTDRLTELLSKDVSWYEAIWVYAVEMFTIWGVPMFLGSIPWAIVSAWLCYRWSLRLSRTVHERRLRRRQLRAERRRAAENADGS